MGLHRGPYQGYGDGEHPLAGYAALIALYNALFAAGLVLARRTGYDKRLTSRHLWGWPVKLC